MLAGLQMKTSSQEQTKAFGVFQNLDAQPKTIHWNDAIFRNRRVSQEIQAHLKCVSS